MTDRSKLLALAEKAATAHEVETRALIAQAFDACHPRQLPAPGGFVHWNPMWNRLTTLFGAKAFLDAAATLVPANSLWNVGTDIDGPYARVLPPVGNGWTNSKEHYVLAATMPLALLSSALRAQAGALS